MSTDDDAEARETLAAVAAKSAAVEAVRLAWEQRIVPRVRAKVADARAHAGRAVTDAARGTPDGRATALRLNASPSLKAAVGRLDDLWAWLAGPSEVSLAGKVRDARAALYQRAAAEWFPLIPAEYRARTDASPTHKQLNCARAAAVHGYDPRRVLEPPIVRARNDLKAALERAVRRDATPAQATAALDQWERAAGDALVRTVVTLLTDSAEHADTTAGRDLIHPDFIED